MINEEEEEDITINIMTLGNSSVGKTSYIIKYTDNYFREIYLSTIGIDRKVKSIKLNNKNIKLIFHDTTGQERFKSLSFNIIKNADGVILMYDITNKESFESIPEWIKNVTEEKGNDFPKILLGNKIDKENKRILSYEEGNKDSIDRLCGIGRIVLRVELPEGSQPLYDRYQLLYHLQEYLRTEQLLADLC